VRPLLDNRTFADWASLFSGEVFVQIIIFADESGTHDQTGKKPGSATTVVGGYFAWKDDWSIFSDKWTGILKDHEAPHFHYSEIVRALGIQDGTAQFDEIKDKKNPFLNWTSEKIFQFLFSLARLIKDSPIYSVGGFTNTVKFHESSNKGEVPWNTTPTIEDRWMYYFFGSVLREINRKMPYLTSPITLTFDQNTGSRWLAAINSAFHFCKSQDNRIVDFGFGDNKCNPNKPLQAADMYVYRSRQITNKLLTLDLAEERAEVKKIDGLLFRREFSGFRAGDIPDWPSLRQALLALAK
jgi:hypothetical protein